MACITDTCLVSWIGFECVVTDCFACNDGTWTGCCSYTSCGTPMCIDTAGDFSGSNNVTLANESNFDRLRTQPLSISAWVKVNPAQSALGAIVLKGDGVSFTDDGIHMIFWEAASSMIFRFADGFGAHRTLSSGNSSFPKDEWHLVTSTYDGSSNSNGMRIYIDGVLTATGTDNSFNFGFDNNCPVTIGSDSNNTNRLDGLIDEAQWWHRELTSCDVEKLYNRGKGIKYEDLPFDFPPPSIAPSENAYILTRGTTATILKRGTTAYKT